MIDTGDERAADGYELAEGVPSAADYRMLRTSTGLSDRSLAAATAGLAGTWFGVVVSRAGAPVGMGRIIGDGGSAFQVVDICVLPSHQGRGLGYRIMRALMDGLERRAPADAYVSLIADGDAHRLYRKFGFGDTAPHSIGMHRFVGTR
ncbi:GNAT family N-acetyltransferase [Streptomyces sp. NPDC018031]|uniref:GNAT family N-acetyltransferase n=1 Tax=Streptomyces sp. NPDC018031 TaxID=3365033 RepID=UPI0037AD431B